MKLTRKTLLIGGAVAAGVVAIVVLMRQRQAAAAAAPKQEPAIKFLVGALDHPDNRDYGGVRYNADGTTTRLPPGVDLQQLNPLYQTPADLKNAPFVQLQSADAECPDDYNVRVGNVCYRVDTQPPLIADALPIRRFDNGLGFNRVVAAAGPAPITPEMAGQRGYVLLRVEE